MKGIKLFFLFIVVVFCQEDLFSNFENYFDKLHYDIVIVKEKIRAKRVKIILKIFKEGMLYPMKSTNGREYSCYLPNIPQISNKENNNKNEIQNIENIVTEIGSNCFYRSNLIIFNIVAGWFF
jgi:hypothetical protein